MKNLDRQNARLEHDKALQRVITAMLSDYTGLFKPFSDGPDVKKWLDDANFNVIMPAWRGQIANDCISS